MNLFGRAHARAAWPIEQRERWLHLGLLWTLACAAPVGGAAFANDTQAQRAHMVSERTKVEAEYARAEAHCRQQFAVNDCLADARSQRRAHLSDLDRQEASLRDAERRQRAAHQIGRIEAKTATPPGPAPGRQEAKPSANAERRQAHEARPNPPPGSKPSADVRGGAGRSARESQDASAAARARAAASRDAAAAERMRKSEARAAKRKLATSGSALPLPP